MFNKNHFDKNDPMLDAINKITERDTNMQPAYVQAAKDAGKEARGLNLADRKEIFKKHMRNAQAECNQMLPADQYVEFDKIASQTAITSGDDS